MNQLLSTRPRLAECPIELLVRSEYGSGFDSFVRSHAVVRVVPGIYVDEAEWRALSAWNRYLAKVHAVHRRRPSAIFIGESAAALHGIPFVGRPQHVHILAHQRGASRVTGAVRAHFSIDDITPVETAGILLTNVADTVVDIARARHPAFGLAALDQAMRIHDLTRGELTANNEARESARGSANAMWALERATGVPESVLESLSLAEIEWLGFKLPELQVAFVLGDLGDARTDCYWPSQRIVGEADGDTKYRLRPGGTGVAVIAEKRREDAIRRQVNGFARWGWADCRDPKRLERILHAAGVPLVAPRDNTRLRTLAALLRA
jgi:hypothetical protein